MSEVAYACGPAARWLPRVLAGSVLAAATVAGLGLPASRLVAGSRAREAIIVLGALVALWVIKSGGELRRSFSLTDDALCLADGPRLLRLPYVRIVSLSFRPPFALTRSWVPATVIVDDAGKFWRLPALIGDGDGMLRELARRSMRNDVGAWIETLSLEDRMARARQWTVSGYLLAMAAPAAALGLLP